MINPPTQNKFHITIISFLFLVSVCAWTVPTQAAEDTLSEKAQQAMARGLAAAKLQDYELAIKYFKEAYESGGEKSPAIIFNLARAYDLAGGRELLAIAWYRAFLGISPRNDKRCESVRQRIIELDIQVESAVRHLIKVAEEVVQDLPSTHRDECISIAEAQAAAGDFDAARESLRSGVRSIRDSYIRDCTNEAVKKRGYGVVILDRSECVVRIALSQWKHADSKAAIETINWALSSTVTTPYPGTKANPAGLEYHIFPDHRHRKSLETLRLFINREWSNHDLCDSEGYRFLSRLYVGSSDNIKDGIIEKFGGFGNGQWDELARALYTYDSFFRGLEIMYKPCWNWDVTATPPKVWEIVASCKLKPGTWGLRHFRFDQDWRVLAKKMKSDYPGRTVEQIAELATDMAQVLYFLRMYNKYHSNAYWGEMWR